MYLYVWDFFTVFHPQLLWIMGDSPPQFHMYLFTSYNLKLASNKMQYTWNVKQEATVQ